MPPDGSRTRELLLDAAARAFAAEGVDEASLLAITRAAGQRNRAALRYHFGDRTAVLCAVLERHVDGLAARERELLQVARSRPDDDVASVVEAVVRPAAELAESGWRGRCFLVIVADLAQREPAELPASVQAQLVRTGGHAVYALLAERIGPIPQPLLLERQALATAFILRSVSDRARALQRPSRRGVRRQLDHDAFVANLVAMVAAAVCAPHR